MGQLEAQMGQLEAQMGHFEAQMSQLGAQKTWFYNIINNQPTGLIPPVVVSNSFSQPLLGATAVINAQTHFSQP